MNLDVDVFRFGTGVVGRGPGVAGARAVEERVASDVNIGDWDTLNIVNMSALVVLMLLLTELRAARDGNNSSLFQIQRHFSMLDLLKGWYSRD